MDTHKEAASSAGKVKTSNDPAEDPAPGAEWELGGEQTTAPQAREGQQAKGERSLAGRDSDREESKNASTLPAGK